jgi:hypothetical protein
MSRCDWSEALGVPGKGFHTHWGGVAWGDVIGTILIAWAIQYGTKGSFSLIAGVLFLLAFGLHEYFCVKRG